MSVFIYNLGIILYRAAIGVASLFNKKAALWIKGRKGIWDKVEIVSRGKGRLVWFHVASLGEFEQGRPVMEKLRELEPYTRIILTFFSPSGYEIRKNYPGADYIFYLPIDFPSNAKKFLDKIKPDVAVFVKYEYWYNYLHELKKRNIRTYLISAIFRPDQPFFKKYGKLHREMLDYFTCLFVQNEKSVELLNSIGISHVELTGDTRFDRVKQIAETCKKIPKIERFCNSKPAVICGSTWPADEDIIFDYINKYTGDYKWVIVPHEIDNNHIQNILMKTKKSIVRFTEDVENIEDKDIMIIDTIGLLSSIYRYGKIAYIGGGFGKGIHNTQEPAIYGIPVIFGPKYHKFKEAVDMIEQGGAFSIKDKTQFNELMDSLLSQPRIAETAGKQALNYMKSQLGATEMIVDQLLID